MVSDLHHLRVTWKDANSARSNYQFKDLLVEEMTSYYGNNFVKTTNKPAGVWKWSGLEKGKYFEPRDD